MPEEGSYQLVLGFPEDLDYQVQKLISNLEHFKDFWRAYHDVNTHFCRIRDGGAPPPSPDNF